MPLPHGTTLGPCSVAAKIGEGGEVYQARNTKLDSDVALKVDAKSRIGPAAPAEPVRSPAVRGESPAWHRESSGSMSRPASARRDEEEYRQYSTPVSSGSTLAASGCSAARMQRDFHHGLAVKLRLKPTRKTERSLTARNFSQSPATRGLDISGRRKSCFKRDDLALRRCLMAPSHSSGLDYGNVMWMPERGARLTKRDGRDDVYWRVDRSQPCSRARKASSRCPTGRTI